MGSIQERIADMKFEVVVIRVAKGERANRFCACLAWRPGADFLVGESETL
jgi:hypothetical protein